MRVFGLLVIFACLQTTLTFSQKLAGTLKLSSDVQPGYTLFTSITGKNTYLIDNCGNVVNKWQSDFRSSTTAYLLTNGNLIRTSYIPNATIDRPGSGGRIEIVNWDSEILWSFEYSNALV